MENMRNFVFVLALLATPLLSCSGNSDEQVNGSLEPVNVKEEEPQETVAVNMALCGTWKIISYGTRDARISVNVKPGGNGYPAYNQIFTLTLFPNGRMTGYGSYFQIRSRFTADDDKAISFSHYSTTRYNNDSDCCKVVNDAIPNVRRYDMDDTGNLLLYYSDTEYLQLTKVAAADREESNPLTGRWEKAMDIHGRDTTICEPGTYLDFTRGWLCSYPALARIYPNANWQEVDYSFDEDYVYFDIDGHLVWDHYELNADGTRLMMYNFQYDVINVEDPGIPVSIYRRLQ